VCWCNFGYLLFFDFNNIWWKTFLPTSSFTSWFKVACSINQILLPLKSPLGVESPGMERGLQNKRYFFLLDINRNFVIK
jgi:hypothetical protein